MIENHDSDPPPSSSSGNSIEDRVRKAIKASPSPVIKLNESGDVEIKLPSKNDFKSWFAVGTAVITFVFAVYGNLKPQDNSVSKTSYEILSNEMKELSNQIQKNHDDVVALRGFTEGVLSKQLEMTPIGSASAEPSQVIKPAAVPTSIKPTFSMKPATPISSAYPSVTVRPSAVVLANLPPASPKPQPIDPPDFDKVLQKARAE